MYCAHFGLREKPFSLSPDPRYFFLSESHREALAHLLYGIEQGEGFIAIIGEVGTGKTTLCRALIQRLGQGTEIAFLWNPELSGLDLLRAISHEFALPSEGRSLGQLQEQLNRFLLEKKREERRVLLVIDEAQNLSDQTLEQIRLLSNLETDRFKLLQIVLLGQPELEVRLGRDELRQLRQRIGVWWRLAPLSQQETGEYVAHRLRIASGGQGTQLFASAALREVYRRSGGIPRLVNAICDRALLVSYAEDAPRVELGAARKAARERVVMHKASPWVSPRAKRWAVAIGVAGFLGAGVTGFFVSGPWNGGRAGWDDLAAIPLPAWLVPRDNAPVQVPGSRIPAEVPEGEATGVDPIMSSPGVEKTPGVVSELEAVSAQAPVEAMPESAVPPLPAFEEIDASTLAERLGAFSPGLSYAHTLRSLLLQWGEVPPPLSVLSISDLLQAIEARGFSIFWVEAGQLKLIEALDHPAILLLPASDGIQRTALLSNVDPESRQVWLEWADGPSLRISEEELTKVWHGDAFVPWHDFERLPELLSTAADGAPNPHVRWLQRALTRLGLYAGDISGILDGKTLSAVRTFQNARGLVPDAQVGPRTKMALYAALEQYAVPHLEGEPSQ